MTPEELKAWFALAATQERPDEEEYIGAYIAYNKLSVAEQYNMLYTHKNREGELMQFLGTHADYIMDVGMRRLRCNNAGKIVVLPKEGT